MHPTLRSLADAASPLARHYLRTEAAPGKQWLYDHFAWRVQEFETSTKFGARMAGHANDLIQRYIYWFGVYQPNLTAWLSNRLQPGDVFVDVGANIGYFSLLAARRVGPSGRVVAIEASPSTYQQLLRNVGLNPSAPSIRTLNMAAGAEPGRAVLFRGTTTNCGQATLLSLPGREAECEVEVAPLDSLLHDEERANLRLVKIDVEGAEMQVLDGALPLIHSAKHTEFVVEGSPERAGEIIDLFHEAGYHAYRVAPEHALKYYFESPARPLVTRLHERPEDEVLDLVFSRTDAATL